MGMEHGTCSQFDKLFAKQHGVTISGSDRIEIRNGRDALYISSFYGDCTGASLYTSEMSFNNFAELLPIAVKYLGFNGRITAFFSRKAHRVNVEVELANLRKNNATGLTVQYCNRGKDKDKFMITGVIKITNPACSGKYLTMHPDMQNDFNTPEKQAKWFENDPCAVNNDFMSENKSFGLNPFR